MKVSLNTVSIAHNIFYGTNKKHNSDVSFGANTIAVTGNIASGKSTVQKLFEQNNIPSIDVDAIVHQLYTEDFDTINRVKEMFKSFGIDSLEDDDFIDRRKIGTIVFRDKNIKKALEDIVHPAVNKKVGEFLKQNESSDYAAIFIPLLFETNQQKNFDYVAMVKVKPDIQLERLLKRNAFLTPDTAMDRINSQMPQDLKAARADFVIDNSSSPAETKKQVEDIIKTLRSPSSQYCPVMTGKVYLKNTMDGVLKNLGFSEDEAKEIFEDFMNTYDKPSRGHHGIKHIETMLKGFDDFMVHSPDSIKVKNPDEFRFAIFMHDYINGEEEEVEKSAEAAKTLLNRAFDGYDASNVEKLIFATDYSKTDRILSFEEKLMQDLDLIILGESREKYNNYAKLIRLQYSDFSDDVFKPARAKIMQGFLDRPFIYNTQYYRARYEEKARENISKEIAALK